MLASLREDTPPPCTTSARRRSGKDDVLPPQVLDETDVFPPQVLNETYERVAVHGALGGHPIAGGRRGGARGEEGGAPRGLPRGRGLKGMQEAEALKVSSRTQDRERG